ncbi:BgTH12-05858 [Blumeria graminis f. sp. triticale]|uniref:BgTH12-05858 n=1 Tax=Blumeria graminis f. sp. triticale TaxID=1689686 RepID=A0A9W4D4T9_BLUGR|nr:BgTH12-05858 [Blumeria graminis f. sp. triticale]
MEHSTSDEYQTRLLKTAKDLEDSIKDYESRLAELRKTVTPIKTEPSSDPSTYIKQLTSLALAYRSIISSEPFTPSHDSLLPHILALHHTSKSITETVLAISQVEASTVETNRRLQKESLDFEDAQQTKDLILARIATLSENFEIREHKTRKTLKDEMMQTIEAKKEYYDNKTSKLFKALNGFIDKYLASMLVVEELGGPTVSQVTNIDDEALADSFNKTSRVKKIKLSQAEGQQRIDKIWGNVSTEPSLQDKKSAVAADMRELLERLLNNAADINSPDPYVILHRESAAARFLVRCKIAQFHPKDATKVRLVNFMGEI